MFGVQRRKSTTRDLSSGIAAPVTFTAVPVPSVPALDATRLSATGDEAGAASTSVTGASAFAASFKPAAIWKRTAAAEEGDGSSGASSPHGESGAKSSARLVAPHAAPATSFRMIESPHVSAGASQNADPRASSGEADGFSAGVALKPTVAAIQAPGPTLKSAAQVIATESMEESTGGSTGKSTGETATAGIIAPSRPAVGFATASTDSQSAEAQPLAPAAAAPTLNKIALENMKEGNPESEWGIDGDGDGNIQGFATNISTNIGGTVDFKIATDSKSYRIDIYRLGYYGGDGARKVGSVSQRLATAQKQDHPIVDMDTGLIDCGNWSVSASWNIPSDAVSGVYFAKLVREDGTKGESIIPFIVREDGSRSDIVFQTSDTTWQAYNEWGGASLYYGNVPTDPNDMIAYMPPNCSCGITAIGRAKAVSYNRPIVTNTSNAGGSHDFIFGAEYSAIRWLEENGYDVSYISGVDTARSGSSLLDHKTFLSVGHDEYWAPEQRQAVEAARDAGVNLAFWGGNDCYWRIRWENSTDASGTPYRTLVCYKETLSNSDIDTKGDTGTWRDPRFGAAAAPENSLIGTMFTVDSYRSDQIAVPYDYSQLRFWRNTDLSQLQPGETGTLVKNLLGYEWNSDVDNGYRPAGLINLSLTNVSVQQYLLDYGSQVGDGDAQHSLTMYRDQESGALVFSAGTVFWSWGLDANHQGAATPADRNVQQAMVNMFADMGIQPTTLVASLISASSTSDFVKPTSTVTSPIMGAALTEGQRITITGTAADGGGGRVAGIEISTDNGQTWRKATGTTAWSYVWVVQKSGTYAIKTRATDDSLNMETPSAGTTITVSLPDTNSLWTLSTRPTTDTTVERKPVELGMRFTSSQDGYVSAIRFYKSQYNVGDHTVDLWTSDGRLLASKLSVDEMPTGWQTVNLTQPIRIQAGVTYVASYHTKGYYAADAGYFNTGYSNGPLSVAANGSVYKYGVDPGTFPDQTFGGENYWVDVVFKAGPAPVNGTPNAIDDSGLTTAGNTPLSITSARLLANDNDPDGDVLTIASVGNALNGTVTLNSQTNAVTFTPTNGFTGAASFSYTVSDGRGGTSSAKVSLQVGAPMPQSVFNTGSTPAVQNSGDKDAVELGMKFVAASDGTVSAIRFYKGSANTGTHTGSLWNASGQRMGTVTFTNETASGWQTATFSTPVSITAGLAYTVSYHTSSGYSYTSNGFGTTIVNGQLTAPSSASSGGNGFYRYGSGNSAPTQSVGANYWVDVVFNPGGVVTNSVPVAANDTGFSTTRNTALALNAATLLANDSDADGDALSISAVGGATNGTVSYNAQTKVVTFTPTSGYSGAAGFTYTVSDGKGGTATATVSLTVSDPTPVNQAPVAVNDSGFSTTKNTALTLAASSLLANDTDADGDTLSITGVSNASNGTVSYNSQTKQVTFTPASGYSGTAGFSYTVSDGKGGTATATVGLTVTDPTPVNRAPVATADSGFSTTKNTAVVLGAAALLANDTDADGDTLTITGVSGATNGSVSYDSQTKQITFTPTAGYAGAASFSYTISDGKGGTASAGVALNVTDPSANESLFATTATPAVENSGDNGAVELGMKFSASVDGAITAVRFFKGSANTGSHTGSLWNASGQRIGNVTFTNETTSGWQTATFTTPVAITAGTTYTVSYSTSSGYSYTSNGFASAVTNGSLTAPANGNGVFRYGAGTDAPSQSFKNTNYWVDVVFNPGGTAPNRSPVATSDAGFSVARNTVLTLNASALLANDSDPDGDTLTITGVSNASNGTVSYNGQTKQVTFTPATGYTGTAGFSYAISDGKGGTATTTVALNVRDPAATQTIFAAADAPTTVRVNDNKPVELGMKFKADVAGTITAIRFFKGADNTGPHEGHLWNASNQLVGTATFTNETSSGWQEAALDTPVNIAAGETYTVSYHTNGFYSATGNGFASNKVSGNLEALSGAVAGGNGVFKYGATGTFPNESFNKTNYYVDVVFKPQLAA